LREFTAGLVARGVPRFAIFQERFDAPRPSAATHPGPLAIRFLRSDQVLSWTPAQGSLLAMAEAAGLALSGGCRVGQCESCRLTLRRGHVVHPAHVDVVSADDCLACVAMPCSDLDLEG